MNYVSPVEGTKEVLLKEEPEIANNKLIFPPASFTKKCSIQPSPESEGRTDHQQSLQRGAERLSGWQR